MRRWIALPALALCATLAMSQGVLGQEGTPAPEGDSASLCQEVESRDAAFFDQLGGTPEAEQEQDVSQATPEGEGESLASLEGESVDEATIAAIEATYQHLVACLNDGDYLRAYALYSDDYLLRNLSAETIGQLEATPVPVEESTRSEFREVIDARRQEDDRLVALVVMTNPQSGDIIIRSTLTQDGERLLIDEESIVDALDQGASADVEATPSG